MESEVYFENIKVKIRKELECVKDSVFVAVAWLTDDDLFADLTHLASKGIGVKIIINDDEINRNSGLNFMKFYENGGLIYFVDSVKNLMHNKFCIIDEIKIINGSFNWTRNANKNIENITIIQNETISKHFLQEFNRLTKDAYHSSEYLAIENLEILELELANGLSYQDLIERGIKRSKNKSYLLAIHDFKNAIKINNSNKSILFDLGFCQLEIGDKESAIHNFTQHLIYYPNSASTYNNRGCAYFDLKQYDKAIKDYSSAILIEKNLKHLENRALCHYALLPSSGNIYLEKTSNFDCVSWGIDFWKKQGNLAIDDYRSILNDVVNENIDKVFYYEKIGEIYNIIGEYEKSILYYSRIISNSNDNLDAYAERAILYLILNNFDGAIRDINKALSFSPNVKSYKDILNLIKSEKRKPKNWFKANNTW